MREPGTGISLYLVANPGLDWQKLTLQKRNLSQQLKLNHCQEIKAECASCSSAVMQHSDFLCFPEYFLTEKGHVLVALN